MWKVSVVINNIQSFLLEEASFIQIPFVWTQFYDNESRTSFALGYFNSKEQKCQALEQLCKILGEEIEAPVVEKIKNEDWQLAYRKYLKPWSYKNLHWVPEWMRDDYPKKKDSVVVWYDAGMAFGTGAHPTTQLCGQRMADFYEYASSKESIRRLSVVDAGCGSGILAISAYALGFSNVIGFDIDNDSIRVSKDNLERNGFLRESLPFFQADLRIGLEGKKSDLIMANIRTPLLREAAENLIAALSPNGVLVLSGILTTELKSIEQTFVGFASKRHKNLEWDHRTFLEWSDFQIRLIE